MNPKAQALTLLVVPAAGQALPMADAHAANRRTPCTAKHPCAEKK
ncbi:hypothetical protein [Accumulibacter sp.]|nr:hypothetical protein [Accumulibacter sp.]